MSVSYDKLWKLMMDKKMNETQLKDAARISTNAVAKLSKNERAMMISIYHYFQNTIEKLQQLHG